ncbi:MAG: HAD-IC family P-type ATPase, partial [Methylotenera sp.]|nr:HAD-IC family P-type ATPase [Oligoflexia bacterium]
MANSRVLENSTLEENVLTPAPPPWSLSVEDARNLVESPPTGITNDEARIRRACSGPNRLAELPPRSAFRVVFDQLKGFLNLLLGLAAIAAWSIGSIKDALMIAGVVTFNTLLGFLQEYKAEKTLAALKGMIPKRTRVRRNGEFLEIDAEEIVPGDLVPLDAGDRVPADGRVVFAQSLELDESALTGESVPATKRHDVIFKPETPLADRGNMGFMNTVVTRGRAELLVTATGARTEIGKIAAMIGSIEVPPTPLQRQLDRLGKRLAAIAVSIVAAIGILEFIRGDTLVQIALESISLAVAAMPEGLPAVVTVTLALGLQRMAKKRAVVKRLAAVETLGSTSVICTDKTGTLTLNRMTAEGIWVRSGSYSVRNGLVDAKAPQLKALMAPLVLCNDVQLHETQLVGDPTETALVQLAVDLGCDVSQVRDANPRTHEIPFESERKFMATFHSTSGGERIFVKGAPDVLLAQCDRISTAVGIAPLGNEGRAEIRRELTNFARQGMRVIAMASKSQTAPGGVSSARDSLSEIHHLEFLGMIGLMDPPREEAREAIRRCKIAGIEVKMITGDHLETAVAIARQLDLQGEGITGHELASLTDSELSQRIAGISVFARVAPAHKLRLVRALKFNGAVVAMTGDGVNDAPALKAA